MSTEDQSKITEQPKRVCVPLEIAVTWVASDRDMSFDAYKQAVHEAIDAGHDLNRTGALLLGAFSERNAEKVAYLFSINAQVAHNKGIHTQDCGRNHAFMRMHRTEIARLLLTHTLASEHFDQIKAYLNGNIGLLGVFDNLTSPDDDEDLAKLYIRLGFLPTRQANDKIQELCGAAGLWYPDVKEAKDKAAHDAEREKATERLKSELTAAQEDLAVCQGELESAQLEITLTQENAQKDLALKTAETDALKAEVILQQVSLDKFEEHLRVADEYTIVLREEIKKSDARLEEEQALKDKFAYDTKILKAELDLLGKQLSAQIDKTMALNEKHILEIEKINEDTKNRKEQHASDIEKIKEQHTSDIDMLKEEHSTIVRMLKEQHASHIENLRNFYAETTGRLERAMDVINSLTKV